jgi:hypothetical protein
MKMKPLLFLFILNLWLGKQLPAQTPGNAERIQNWQEDIDFYEKTLRSKHKNLFHLLHEATFTQQLAALKNKIDQLSDYQMIVELSKIAAAIGDGHTYIHTDRLKQFWMPLKIEVFAEGFFILSALPEYKSLLGTRILGFDDKNIADAVNALKQTCATDLRFDDRDYHGQLPVKMMQASLLHALGVINSAEQHTIRVEKEGQEMTLSLKNIHAEAADFLSMGFESYTAKEVVRPVSYQNSTKNYAFTFLPQSKAMYLAYNNCQQDPAEKMDAMTDRLFAEFVKNGAEKLIIDVRRNGGGNSHIHNKLVKEIIKHPIINQKGHLFVLMGPRTFSAANILILDLENNTQVITIGVHGRGKPNHYSENYFFNLPHSKQRCSVSELYRVDSRKDDNRIRIEPQLAVESSFADYRNNRDAVLETALDYKIK